MSTTKENRNYCLVTMRSWIKSWKHALTEMQRKIENQSNLTLPRTLCTLLSYMHHGALTCTQKPLQN
jgi:hypothetical protein